jgi:hypothetical protein
MTEPPVTPVEPTETDRHNAAVRPAIAERRVISAEDAFMRAAHKKEFEDLLEGGALPLAGEAPPALDEDEAPVPPPAPAAAAPGEA